jgi:hypothetical protein
MRLCVAIEIGDVALLPAALILDQVVWKHYVLRMRISCADQPYDSASIAL